MEDRNDRAIAREELRVKKIQKDLNQLNFDQLDLKQESKSHSLLIFLGCSKTLERLEKRAWEEDSVR